VKRFYKAVEVVPGGAGFEMRLDERPVCTPGRALLAEAVAAEWRRQGETIEPASMPFTGLANAAIDHIAPNRESFAAGIAHYGTTDLLCYRAEGPRELVARQAALWDPLIAWAQARYGVTLKITQGIMHVEQPAETLERLGAAVVALDAFTLAGLSTLVTISGSLICGLAIDEAWQAEQWGEDAEAITRAVGREADFSTSCAFCAMART
jgi:chaperone required for assembly of F1-ATPase